MIGQESLLDLLVDLDEQSLSHGLVFEDGHNRPEELLRVKGPIYLPPFALLVDAVACLCQHTISVKGTESNRILQKQRLT